MLLTIGVCICMSKSTTRRADIWQTSELTATLELGSVSKKPIVLKWPHKLNIRWAHIDFDVEII